LKVRPKTAEGILALPAANSIDSVTIYISDEDRERGYVIFKGRRITVKSDFLATIRIPIVQSFRAVWQDADEPVRVIDYDGFGWKLAQDEDGNYVKMRA
jgi:hypothetical protein